jgi:hypothetical protein
VFARRQYGDPSFTFALESAGEPIMTA